MKLAPLILPVIVFALAGIWVADQRRAISTLEDASASLQKHLVTARSSSPATDAPPAKPAAQATATKGKESLAWKKLAAEFSEMKTVSRMGRIQRSLDLMMLSLSMSQEELVAALDEISALESPVETRAELEQILFSALRKKDPKLALTRYMDRLHDESGKMPENLSSAMQAWAKNDPAEATAWFDQQIAAGQFDSKSLDGKSETRNQFEKALIQALLGKDPATISRRLGAMTPDQRMEVLGGWSGSELIQENFLSFATLVRSQVPEKEQVDLLAQRAGRMVSMTDDGGFAEALDFMDRIAATPAERIACAENAAKSSIIGRSFRGKITRTDLDAVREWTKVQAPDSTDQVTGKAIAVVFQIGQKLDFAAASELVLHYHQASGNDDVLTSFLVALPRHTNTEQARALALKITDAKRRAEILQKFK
jgi:HAMP domain-containing protein